MPGCFRAERCRRFNLYPQRPPRDTVWRNPQGLDWNVYWRCTTLQSYPLGFKVFFTTQFIETTCHIRCNENIVVINQYLWLLLHFRFDQHSDKVFYVGKIPLGVNREHLRQHFSQFGSVIAITLINSARERFAFVQMGNIEARDKALHGGPHIIAQQTLTVRLSFSKQEADQHKRLKQS